LQRQAIICSALFGSTTNVSQDLSSIYITKSGSRMSARNMLACGDLVVRYVDESEIGLADKTGALFGNFKAG
tara:strand:- start:207 stop:422 length:216 start_codon:yes stop_codon:yes gene_type:complete